MNEGKRKPYCLILAVILRNQYVSNLQNLNSEQVDLLKEIMSFCIQEVFNGGSVHLIPFIQKWSSISIGLFDNVISQFQAIYDYIQMVSLLIVFNVE